MKSCHNCKNAYPKKYWNSDTGPCLIFELWFGSNGWEELDYDKGCKGWRAKGPSTLEKLADACEEMGY